MLYYVHFHWCYDNILCGTNPEELLLEQHGGPHLRDSWSCNNAIPPPQRHHLCCAFEVTLSPTLPLPLRFLIPSNYESIFHLHDLISGNVI